MAADAPSVNKPYHNEQTILHNALKLLITPNVNGATLAQLDTSHALASRHTSFSSAAKHVLF